MGLAVTVYHQQARLLTCEGYNVWYRLQAHAVLAVPYSLAANTKRARAVAPLKAKIPIGAPPQRRAADWYAAKARTQRASSCAQAGPG